MTKSRLGAAVGQRIGPHRRSDVQLGSHAAADIPIPPVARAARVESRHPPEPLLQCIRATLSPREATGALAAAIAFSAATASGLPAICAGSKLGPTIMKSFQAISVRVNRDRPP